MKTLLVLISLVILPSSYLFAESSDEKERKEKEVDSTEVSNNESSEDAFTISIEDNEVKVIANGQFGIYASVSLTTNRGSDIFFEFLKNNHRFIHQNKCNMFTYQFIIDIQINHF